MRTRCLEQRGVWKIAVAVALLLSSTARGQALKEKKSADPDVAAAALRMSPPGQEWWRVLPGASDLEFNPAPDRSSVTLDGGIASLRAADCCPQGGWITPLGFAPVWQGNVFSIIEPVLLKRIEIEASFNGPRDITFGIYRETENAPPGNYTSLRIQEVSLNGNGRQFYSSGTLGTGGVLLQPLEVNGVPVTTFFAVAVGWGSVVIDTRIDDLDYSNGPSFCAGRVWGSWAQTNVTGPPPPGGEGSHQLGGITFAPSGVISFNLCFEVPGGACCLGDTTCVDDVTSNACTTELGGDFLGLFTLCALDADQCTGFGACCSVGGNCSITRAADCVGTYKGDGTECDPLVDPCSSNLGGCCRYDGFCEAINEYDCELDPSNDTPGTWLGEGVECLGPGPGFEPNCEPLGACCDGVSTCTDVPVDQCEVNQCINTTGVGQCLPTFEIATNGECPDVGQPQCFRPTGLTYSPGQPCAFEPCKSQFNLGACCVLGECSVDTKLDCENMGGVFSEVGTNGITDTNGWQACDIQAPDFCDATLDEGACCLANDECVVRTEAQCASTNGVFQGFGLACSAFLCNDGACCHTDILGEPDCVEVRPLECAATSGLAGQFQGSGTTCPSDCFVTGACCFGDASCKQLSEVECMTSNGTYSGDDTFCSLTECPVMAACCFEVLGTPQCSVMTSNGCAQVTNSTFGDPGTTCDPDAATACQVGACCMLDTTCTNGLRANCDAIAFGEFQGDGTTCGFPACPVRGACCVPDVDGFVCEVREPGNCDASGQVYRGDAVACDATVCERAPCCQPNGSCEDQLPSECLAVNGEPGLIGDRCAEADFCTNGACCVDPGGGAICLDGFQRVVCESGGGAFKGGGVACIDAPDICSEFPSACCLPDGSCADLIPSVCAAQGGSTGVGTEMCAVADFCTIGACCVDIVGTPTCFADTTLLDCGASNGTFQGAGTACTPGLCAGASGACCKTDGTCEDLDDVGCAGMAGAVFLAGEACATATCPEFPAACCEIDGACTEITATACGAIGGAIFNPGETCATAGCVDLCGAAVNSDFNTDGVVDLLDYAAFQLCFGDSASAACLCPFDANGDGTVDLLDFSTFIADLEGTSTECDPFVASGPGDFDGDGDVDLTDYAAFQQCFIPGTETKCRCIFDLDASGTVDLVDMALLEPLIIGP